jgi:hypothetical protein
MSGYILRKGVAQISDLSDGAQAMSSYLGADGYLFYVDPSSAHGAGIGYVGAGGRKTDESFLTLQAAIDSCRHNHGDVIVCKHGTQSLAADVDFNKRGITVMAEGTGYGFNTGERFMLYAPASGPAATITEPCTILGLGFAGQDVASGSHNVLISGLGGGFFGGYLRINYCRFATWGASPDYALLCEGMTNADISYNVFDGGYDTYAVGAIGISSATDGIQVSGCRFKGNRFSSIGENKYAFVHLAGKFPNHNTYESNVLVGNATDAEGAKAAGKFLDNNGCTNYDTFLFDNFIGLATNTGSYDDTVATLQGLGVRFAANHYSE